MLQTDAQFPAIGSNNDGLVKNEDGSYDIYFAPEAPEGHEANWVQTVPGKGWNTILRLYGPLEPWFEQTWRPGEIELIEYSNLETAKAAAAGESAEEIMLRITVDGRAAVYGVQFDTGSTGILPRSEDTLGAIAAMMDKLPDLKIAVVGHTDDVGSYESNLDLSKRRADAVVSELVGNYGIDKARLFAAGASFLAPVASNETEEGPRIKSTRGTCACTLIIWVWGYKRE